MRSCCVFDSPRLLHFPPETTEPYIQESTGENGSLNDLEYDDYAIGMALSSPLFTQEREDDASRRRAYHSQDEGCRPVSRRLSVMEPGDPLWNSLTHKFQTSEKIRAHSSENEQTRILLETTKRADSR